MKPKTTLGAKLPSAVSASSAAVSGVRDDDVAFWSLTVAMLATLPNAFMKRTIARAEKSIGKLTASSAKRR